MDVDKILVVISSWEFSEEKKNFDFSQNSLFTNILTYKLTNRFLYHSFRTM